MGKRLNYSFDLVEWGAMDVVKGLPLQVIWSGDSSKEWSAEGRSVAEAFPRATFVTHSGGQWPQENNAEEIAKSIHQFVLSLPKPHREVEEEPIPEHIQIMLNEAKSGKQHDHHGHGHGHGSHHHGHDHDEHSHAHAHAGYADAYGLGHGWAI
ncbi:hypothetical protein M9H77_27614 [Catharanthus roseus]|uniref:Uncharacterized protein n=1 Tax=Catharanthus roseus TaxID=4058 RepID=A0ACC0AE10_CATRO|nr:hypothetical protein M9H77_27614 [Catharanthus roseus]